METEAGHGPARPGFIGRLGSGMFLDFCDDEITAYRLCKHMQHAVQDGSECRLSKTLAKIGSKASAVSVANEDVMHLMSSLPALGIISRLPASTTTHFIKPTDLIRLFQDHYPLQFRLRFRGGLIHKRLLPSGLASLTPRSELVGYTSICFCEESSC